MPVRYSKEGEPYVDPARMKARITFLRQVVGQDATGASVTYAPASPPDVTWAEINPVRGTDVIKAGQDVGQVFISVVIRYRPPGRAANMRFQDSRGLVYVIQAIEDIAPGALRYQVLTCLLIAAKA